MIRIPPQEQLNAASLIGHHVLYIVYYSIEYSQNISCAVIVHYFIEYSQNISTKVCVIYDSYMSNICKLNSRISAKTFKTA